MPELMVDLIVSLDGWAAADGWPGLWGMGGPDYFAFLGEQEEHTTLMGATTYRLMSGMADEEPAAFAELAAADKVVFSSSLAEPLARMAERRLQGLRLAGAEAVEGDGEVVDPDERHVWLLQERGGWSRTVAT